MTKWTKPPVDAEKVRTLADTHGLDLLTASILTRRGVMESAQVAYFIESDERFLHNPMLFPQMEQAVERVLHAAEEGEKVLVCGDKDADGITATVLMVEALQSLGLDPHWRVPVGEEDYGLNSQVLKAKETENITLVIAVDCGITNFDEVELANKLGMDVLIFDHHLPREGSIPPAYAVINPKLPGSYPFEGLCAATLASKFQWALCLAGTDLWCEEFCLVLAKEPPSGPDITLEVLRMRNLLEVQYITISTEDGEAGREEFLRVSEGLPLLVYGQSKQAALISRFFNNAEVHVVDIEQQVVSMFPALKGASIEDLQSLSRLTRYFSDKRGSITTLKNLVVTFYMRHFSSSFSLWRRGLDIAAIGTLADLMPLMDENRILVNLGIERINGTDGLKDRRIALRELLIRQKLQEGRVDTVEMAWKVCPLVNASGRMGQADLGVELLLSHDESRITALADKLVDLNKQRRSLGEQTWNRIRPAAYESMKTLNNQMAIVRDNEAPRGITGILASRLLQTLNVPSVVIARCKEGASGSIRCDSRMNAVSWLEAMSPLLNDYGGHVQAGGFRLDYENIDPLIEECRKWLAARSKLLAPKEPILIDAELSHIEINRLGPQGLIGLLERLEPYGQGFRPLVFLTRSVPIHNAELVGRTERKSLKLTVSLGSSKWPALWWDGADRYGKDIRNNEEVDLVYHIDRDRWRGEDARRVTILEAIPCGT